MGLIWAFVLLFGTVEASYLRDGCLVRNSINERVDIDSSLNFTIRRSLISETQISIPSQNVTLSVNNLPPSDSSKIWLDVQLLFYPEIQLRLSDGQVLAKSDKGAEPPQNLSVKNAEILTHCPQEEPVWYMDKSKTINLPLDGNDSVVIIPQEEMLNITITLNGLDLHVCPGDSQVLTLQQDLTETCNTFQKRKEYKISFLKGRERIEIHNADKILQTKDYNGKDATLSITLTMGRLHLVHLPQKRKGTSDAKQQQTADSCPLMLALFICTLLLLIIIVVIIIVLYKMKPTNLRKILLQDTAKTTARNVNNEPEILELPDKAPTPPKRSVGPSSSSGSYGSHHLLLQASRQNSNNSNVDQSKQKKFIPNKAYSDEQYDARRYESASEVRGVTRYHLPPTDPANRESDYNYIRHTDIHAVKPSEIAILKNENVIAGNVAQVEYMDKNKGQVFEAEGDYLSLGGENSEDPDQSDYLCMANPNGSQIDYTPEWNDDPIYANFSR